MHHSRVQYNSGQHALKPFQMLPVWSLKSWRLVNNFVAVAHAAVLQDNKIVARDLEDRFDVEEMMLRYNDWAVATSRRQLGLEVPSNVHEDNYMMGKLRVGQVGHCGGVRVVQPDHLPIGCLPMRARSTIAGTPTWHHQPLTLWDWLEAVACEKEEYGERFVRLPDFRPEKPWEIAFFIQEQGGGVHGWDVVEEEHGEFKQIPLPFSWQAAEDIGLINHSQGDIYTLSEQNSSLAVTLSAQVRRLKMQEGWGTNGYIYVGIIDPTDSSVDPKKATLEEVLTDSERQSAIYQMPFIPGDPWSAVDYETVARVGDLKAGSPQAPLPARPAALLSSKKRWF